MMKFHQSEQQNTAWETHVFNRNLKQYMHTVHSCVEAQEQACGLKRPNKGTWFFGGSNNL
jgi:hypothetical protein